MVHVGYDDADHGSASSARSPHHARLHGCTIEDHCLVGDQRRW